MFNRPSTKPTVLCIAADLDPARLGGAEVHAVEVIKRLAYKYNFYLVVGPSDTIGKILPKSVQVIKLDYPKIPNLYGLSFALTGYLKLKKQIIRLNPDLIWAKQSYPQALLAALIKPSTKAKLYITAQNPNLIIEELVVKGTLLKPLHKLFAQILKPCITFAYSKADLIAPVSQYSKHQAIAFGANKTQVIPNGVDTSKFHNKPLLKNAPKTWGFLTTSALIPRNGIDILIESLALLPANLNWHLTVAGDGPMFKELKDRSMMLVHEAKITWLGRVTHDQVPQLLATHHLFIRPSRAEGFGVSFIESLAAGVPVIATPVGGIPDFITSKKNGWLVNPNTPEAVAQAITKLTSDLTLYRKLQHNGISTAGDYSWDKVANKVDLAWKNLLN